MTKRSVWRDANPDDCYYVPRCSNCGRFRSDLKEHWFFTGMYCVPCIQDRLYDNGRTIKELP